MRRVGAAIALTAVLGSACRSNVAEVFREPPAATYTAGSRQVRIGGELTTMRAAAVTPDFFREAGASPLIGRFFVEADYSAASQRVVVLSYELWTRHFGAKPDVIGNTIDIDGEHTIVTGVAQRGFKSPGEALLWTPKAPR
jgi:hypothetical protein